MSACQPAYNGGEGSETCWNFLCSSEFSSALHWSENVLKCVILTISMKSTILILGAWQEDLPYNLMLWQRLVEKMRKVFEAECFLYRLITLVDRVRDPIQSSKGVSLYLCQPTYMNLPYFHRILESVWACSLWGGTIVEDHPLWPFLDIRMSSTYCECIWMGLFWQRGKNVDDVFFLCDLIPIQDWLITLITFPIVLRPQYIGPCIETDWEY